MAKCFQLVYNHSLSYSETEKSKTDTLIFKVEVKPFETLAAVVEFSRQASMQTADNPGNPLMTKAIALIFSPAPHTSSQPTSPSDC